MQVIRTNDIYITNAASTITVATLGVGYQLQTSAAGLWQINTTTTNPVAYIIDWVRGPDIDTSNNVITKAIGDTYAEVMIKFIPISIGATIDLVLQG